MSAREFRCGNCGADVTFDSPGALVVVCTHCRWASYRKDIKLETLYEVSQVTPLSSNFRIGTEGWIDGRRFVVRGQLQLDHGAGLWNEWAAEDEAGDWLWIAEAQGRTLLFGEVDVRRQLEPVDLDPGGWIDLAYGDRWFINERGQGRVVTVAGELPIEPPPLNSDTIYVDFQRGEREVATMDWTRREPELLMGRAVNLVELSLDPTTVPDLTPDRVEAKRIDCANCGAGIELLDPEHSQRIGCSSCGHLLAVDDVKTRVLQAQAKAKRKPDLPLGASANLRGQQLRVLGVMERRVTAMGRWWPWREYLCRTPEGGYRWLVENDGHWMTARPVQRSAVLRHGKGAGIGGEHFKHYTGGKAEVHWVLGEFYWEVQAGDTSQAIDWVSGQRMISSDATDSEVHASLCEHLEPDEVAQAFGLANLRKPHGVGALQPNPHDSAGVWKIFFLAAALLLVAFLYFHGSAANEIVLAEKFGPAPANTTDEQIEFTEPFELKEKSANLRIRFDAPTVNQGWLGLNGALVNVDSGEVRTFATAAQYYSGRSGGESWREGKRWGSSLLGSVPGGVYRLRLAVTAFDRGLSLPWELRVQRQVPRTLHFFLALIALLVFPVINQIVHLGFEKRRWDKSDHPWGE